MYALSAISATTRQLICVLITCTAVMAMLYVEYFPSLPTQFYPLSSLSIANEIAFTLPREIASKVPGSYQSHPSYAHFIDKIHTQNNENHTLYSQSSKSAVMSFLGSSLIGDLGGLWPGLHEHLLSPYNVSWILLYERLPKSAHDGLFTYWVSQTDMIPVPIPHAVAQTNDVTLTYPVNVSDVKQIQLPARMLVHTVTVTTDDERCGAVTASMLSVALSQSTEVPVTTQCRPVGQSNQHAFQFSCADIGYDWSSDNDPYYAVDDEATGHNAHSANGRYQQESVHQYGTPASYIDLQWNADSVDSRDACTTFSIQVQCKPIAVVNLSNKEWTGKSAYALYRHVSTGVQVWHHGCIVLCCVCFTSILTYTMYYSRCCFGH